MTKTQWTFALATVALLGVVIFLLTSHPKVAEGAINPNDPAITNFTRVAANDFINGGVDGIDFRIPSGMNQASTTACNYTTPAATSTLDRISALFTVGSSTQATITIATSTAGGSASTTPLMSFTLAANAQGTFVFEPTTTDKTVLAPSTGVVVTMTGGNGTFSPTGVCTIRATTLN